MYVILHFIQRKIAKQKELNDLLLFCAGFEAAVRQYDWHIFLCVVLRERTLLRHLWDSYKMTCSPVSAHD